MTTRLIPRFAVIPTHNRHDQLVRLINGLKDQCDYVVVIDNASEPPLSVFWLRVQTGKTVTVIPDAEQPPNLSRLWNRGIWLAEQGAGIFGHQEWDVAILNDDAVVPAGWWDAVSYWMRLRGATAGSSDPFDRLRLNETHMFHADSPPSTSTRLAGWAFMLRGESGLKADERLRWWYADDLLSLQARERGGLVHVGGFPVSNTCANTSTVGELAEQAGRDRETFVQITGRQPW